MVGAELYWKILVGSSRNGPKYYGIQLCRILDLDGFGGELTGAMSNFSMVHLVITNEVLNKQIKRFWKQEELPEVLQYTKEEQYCEQYFIDTVKRNRDGRFIVRLSQRGNVTLRDSKEQAFRQLLSLERRFARNRGLQQEYGKFMNDYFSQNHMSPLTCTETQGSECYVLLHQAVMPDSVITKLRVFFDASAKTTFGTSLKDKLIPGNLQGDLIDIMLLFRTYRYVVTANVAVM